MNPDVTIRPAQVADAAAMAALHVASFEHAWSSDSIATLVNGPGGRAWMASGPAGPIGFAILHVVPPESELLSIGVPPHARRSGIGRRLLRHAAGELCRDGVETMFLDVAADNLPAIGLYRALGFRDISIRPRYYPGNVDAIVMQAELEGIA